MTDEKKAEEAGITFDEIVRFFKSVSPDAKCFACGGSSWTVMLDDDEVTVSEASIGKGGTLARYFPTYLTVCAKCGFVKPHHQNVVKKWLEDNPAGEAEEGPSSD